MWIRTTTIFIKPEISVTARINLLKIHNYKKFKYIYIYISSKKTLTDWAENNSIIPSISTHVTSVWIKRGPLIILGELNEKTDDWLLIRYWTLFFKFFENFYFSTARKLSKLIELVIIFRCLCNQLFYIKS